MNIDTRYEETKFERTVCNIVEILATILLAVFVIAGFSGCATQSDQSVSNAANQCYPNGLHVYAYHGGTGSLKVVCK